MTAAEFSIHGGLNFRDTGGLRAVDGRSTRAGVLFRSGGLNALTPAGVDQVRRLGLKRIVDLRDDAEVLRAPTPDLGLVVDRMPLFMGSVESFFSNDVSLGEMYRRILEEGSGGVAHVARAIVNDQPVLVHCTAGKDRTGVTVALTLSAAGVSDEAVIADYARTERELPPQRNAAIIGFLRPLYPDAVHLEALVSSSPAEVMVTMLEEIRAQYGSAADYLRATGVTDDEIAELSQVLISPE